VNIPAALNMVTLEQNGAAQTLIPAAEMARLQQAQDIIQSARQRAIAYLQTARIQRRQQRKRSQRRLAQQQRGWRRHYDRQFALAKEKGTQAALQWLVDQQQWERLVYQRLTHEIASQLSQRLREISQHLPWEKLLFEQLGPLYKELQTQPSLTLKVAPALYERLPTEVKALPLVIEQQENLPPGDAVLENQLVRVELKLPGQLEQLCDALATLRWEQLYEPD